MTRRSIEIRLDDLTYRDVEPIEWEYPLTFLRANDPLGSTFRWWVRTWRTRYRDEREQDALIDLGGES